MWQDLANSVLYRWRALTPRLRLSTYGETGKALESDGVFPAFVLEQMSPESQAMSFLYAWLLEQIPECEWRGEIRAIDLGSQHFPYALGLAAFLHKRADFFRLEGLELDPYRLYWNFYRRGDRGHYFSHLATRAFGHPVTYETGDWLQWCPQVRYDLITCFFPFLFEDLHGGFGLPRRSFSPRIFYQKIFRQTSTAIFFHQGDEETETSLRLIEEDGTGRVHFQKRFVDNPYIVRRYPITVILWRKSL